MKKFEGTIKDFISNITDIKKGYLRKTGANKMYGMWWEENDPTKYHLMNFADKTINAKEFNEGGQVTKHDIEHRIQYLLNKGYEMYL